MRLSDPFNAAARARHLLVCDHTCTCREPSAGEDTRLPEEACACGGKCAAYEPTAPQEGASESGSGVKHKSKKKHG